MRKRTRFGLAALVAGSLALFAHAGTVIVPGYIDSFIWSMRHKVFGGLSAIEVSEDGQRFSALTDRGVLFNGQIARGDDGRILRLYNVGTHVLQTLGGQPLYDGMKDSEGLAITPAGQIYISFEGPARVALFDASGQMQSRLALDPDFADMPVNKSLEALAVRADGVLFSLPENFGDAGSPVPVYRYANGAWDQPFAISRDAQFLPVAADFGPDGHLYVLERNFRGLLGFESRIRRFVISGNTIDQGEIVWHPPAGRHQNLEGLSVWQDAAGDLRLTMISDDNFLFLLGTFVEEYRLPY